MDSAKTERFERGWEKLKEIDGEAGVKVIESLKDISPDLGRYTIEYPFGDVYSREVLNNKTKEIAVIAALTAIGSNARPQLKVRLNAFAQHEEQFLTKLKIGKGNYFINHRLLQILKSR